MNLIRRLVTGGVLIPKNKTESGQIRMSRANRGDDSAEHSDD